ncbi:MAG TPA: NADH-quinone oxidoreductase subunit M [Chloroflexota bacterium]|nr:NADH-quinone oxidoreductase subunit M [Chloroflexota bacterium]
MPITGNAIGIPLLTIILGLPAAAAVLCMFVDDERAIRLIAVIAAVADFVLAAIMLVKLAVRPSGGWVFQFADRHDWVSTLGITYWIGVDGIAAFLVALTALIFAIGIVASVYMIVDRVKLFMTFMLFLEAAVLGVFMSVNLFLFFVFWEAMLIPSYFLLGMWGEERRVYATTKFVLYTVLGSFFMLVAIFYLWTQTGTLDMAGPHGLVAHPISGAAQYWLFLAFAIAFAIKMPIWPFHSWAPTAYTESPIPFLVVLSGILSKAGAFGFIRYCLPLFPEATRAFAGTLSVLAIIGMLYAAGLALVQTDIKRLVAYASISHMNLIALGIFSLNATGLDGSTLQMVNHSVIITGLFLAVAFIVARSGTRMLTDMGGMGARWPILMWVFFVFVLAGLDLPGLGSFSGEFLILAGVFRSNAWYSAIAALTVILAAWYMIRLFQRTMNGPQVVSPEAVAATADRPDRTPYQYPVVRRLISNDLLPRELVLLVPLLALVLYIGVQPDPVTTRLNATTNQTASLVHRSTSTVAGAAP